VKFKDADLIGLPLRITIGGRGLKEGVIEMKIADGKRRDQGAAGRARHACVRP